MYKDLAQSAVSPHYIQIGMPEQTVTSQTVLTVSQTVLTV